MPRHDPIDVPHGELSLLDCKNELIDFLEYTEGAWQPKWVDFNRHQVSRIEEAWFAAQTALCELDIIRRRHPHVA